MEITQKIEASYFSANCPGDRQAAEGALERNLSALKFIRFYTIHPPFLTLRKLNHILQITAILKLPKLPAYPLPVIATQPPRGVDIHVRVGPLSKI